MSSLRYTITITSQTTSQVIFTGTFTTNSNFIVTEFYENGNTTNLIYVPPPGTHTSSSYDNLTGYDYVSTNLNAPVVLKTYDNAYKPSWLQFDPNGIMLTSFPGVMTYNVYCLSSTIGTPFGFTGTFPMPDTIGTILGLASSQTTPTLLDTVSFSIQPVTIPPPISNTCFPKNTPIFTDQGMINIQDILPHVHTIYNKPIVAVTSTFQLGKHLVCFEKNALGPQCPTQRTMMSEQHKVRYQGKMVEARWFLDKFPLVHTVPYDGKELHNIVMQKHTVICVNNMTVETLDPTNIVAKIYSSRSPEQAQKRLLSIARKRLLKRKVSMGSL